MSFDIAGSSTNIGTQHHKPISHNLKKITQLFKKNSLVIKKRPVVSIETQVAQVSAILQQQDISRSPSDIKYYLKILNNDILETAEQLTCLTLAEIGILVSVPSSNQLKGVENSEGTSCYLGIFTLKLIAYFKILDTILFAMYSQETAFDCLLHLRQLKSKTADKLQTLCRFFVNLLRSNCLIRKEVVEQIRQQLILCGWESTKKSQEDAVELFLFLTGILELPFLPLNVKLFHGAIEDQSNDDKFTSDRVLALSLPNITTRPSCVSIDSSADFSFSNRNTFRKSLSPTDQVLHIEDLLLDYFCSNKIQGLRRKINSEEGRHSEKTAITDAWSVLKLLPFYTSQSELGNISDLRESDLTDPDLVLPLMIKRYSIKPDGGVYRDSRPIALSTEINFNKFVKKLDDAVTDRSRNEYRLQLRAVVCHLGTSLQSGHYIVYVRDLVSNDWIQLDDLGTEKVKRHTSIGSATKAFETMSQNSYLALYKLRTGSVAANLRANTEIVLDSKLAQKMQARELSHLREKSCKIQ